MAQSQYTIEPPDTQPATPQFTIEPPDVSAPSPTRALPKATGLKAQPKPFSKQWFKEGLFRGTATTAEALPAAGAMIGGMIGGTGGTLVPGAGNVMGTIGGAGMGGMAGDAARQLLLRALGYPSPTVPSTSAQAAQQITKQGAEQAALQAVSEIPVGSWLRGSAEQGYERAIAPTGMKTKVVARKVVPELIKRGEFGSLESLQERAATRARAINPQLDVAYAQTSPATTLGSGTTIISDLDRLKEKYIVQGKVANPAAVNAIQGVQNIVQQYGADIDPVSLRKLKGIFDDPVAHAGAYEGTDLGTRYTLKAQKAAANSIRSIMNQANPDVAALDKEIHFWLNVQKVTSATILRRTGQSGGLVKVLAPLAAAGGAAVGRGGVEGGAIDAAAVVLTQLGTDMVRSPAWRTTSAVVKSRIADALARGNVGELLLLGARTGLAAPAAAERASQPLPGKDQTTQ